jgi:copper chaperone NosL
MKIFVKIFVLLYFVSVILGCSGVNEATVSSTSSLSLHKTDHNYSVVQESLPRSFDDIGSALKWREGQCILHQSAFDGGANVFDYYTGEAIPGKEAFYIIKSRISTPGGHNTIAFKDMESYEKFLSGNGKGKIITLDSLIGSEE